MIIDLKYQLDYINFFYGSSFLLLGIMILLYRRGLAEKKSWRYLVWFAFFHGVKELVNIILIITDNNQYVVIIKIIFLVLSFVYLVEFARTKTLAMGVWAPGRWIYLPVLALIGIFGAMAGSAGIKVGVGYFLGIAGGAWAVWISKKYNNGLKENEKISIAIVFLALYFFFDSVIVPRIPVFPATVINEENFLLLTGIPVQLFRGTVAMLAALVFWRYVERKRHEKRPMYLAGRYIYIAVFPLIYLSIIIIGWAATDWVGRGAESHFKGDLISKAQISVSLISKYHLRNAIAGTLESGELEKLQLKEQEKRIISQYPDIADIDILYKADNKIFSLYDNGSSIGLNEYIRDEKNDKVYQAILTVFKEGVPSVVQDSKESGGKWISSFVPITDNKQVIAAISVKALVSAMEADIARERVIPMMILILIYFLLVFHYINDHSKWENEDKLIRLKNSAEKAKALLESVTQGITEQIMLLDMDYKIIWANKAVYDKFGNKEKNNIIGNCCYKVTHGSNKKCFYQEERCPINEFLKNGTTYGVVHTHHDNNGQKSFVEVSVYPIKNKDGKIVQFIHVSRDITERRRMENSLIESEEKYRTVVGNSNDLIWILNREGIYTYVNKAIEDIGGVRSEDILGKSFEFMIPSGEFLRIKDIFRRILNGEKIQYEIKVIGIEKKTRILSVNSVPLYKNGSIEGTISFGRDITEERNALLALREEKNKLEKYFNITGIIVLIIDSAGKISFINRKGAEMMEYDPAEISGKNLFNEIIFENDKFHAKEAFEKLSENKENKIYIENHLITKNGKKKSIAWRIVAINAGNRESVLFICAGEDITELKKANIEISELKEVDKMKDDFLNVVAHELRTPLTSIIGLSEIIRSKKDNLTLAQVKYLDIIHREGIRLSRIVKRMLTITRFESGRQIIYSKPIDLEELISSLLPSFSVLSDKVRVNVNIEKNIEIISDWEKISEVIINLVENAIKYGPEEQIIAISAIRTGKGTIRIEVADQGPGIPEDKKDKLFVKFSQLNSSFARPQEGTGLGLYICKLIVEGLGGEIGYKNNDGGGATFFFTLPGR